MSELIINHEYAKYSPEQTRAFLKLHDDLEIASKKLAIKIKAIMRDELN